MSNLDKEVLLKLENTAYSQQVENLNVAFSTADRDSAVFYFKITKQNQPLLLGNENIIGRIAIKQNNTISIVAPLVIEDGMNGLMSYKLPKEVLQKDGQYQAQVLVAEKGDSNTVVAERIFTFSVVNSLFSKVDAETKINYVVEFEDTLLLVKQRMDTIDQALANGEDYVTQVNQAREKGLSDIQIALTDALSQIDAKQNEGLQLIITKGDEYSSKFDSDKAYVDEQITSFRESVNASGVITTSESTNWQKYKLTDDSGNHNVIALANDVTKLRELKPGFYYTTSTPITGASSTAGFTHVEQRDNTVKRITFKPYNSNNTYVMRFYNEWFDWENAMNDMETTSGSQSKANVAESNAKVYADDKYNKRNTILFEGTANGVGSVINLSESLDNFIMLFFYGTFPGGLLTEIGNPMGTSKISLTPTNLVDSDGNGGGIYELGLAKTTRTSLTITTDVFFDLGKQLGSGANANKCTINRIVGVRK